MTQPTYPQLLAQRTAQLGVSPDDLAHLHRVFYGDLHLCGCGQAGQAWTLLHRLLALFATPGDYGQRQAALRTLVGSDGATHMILSMLDEARLTDHGGSALGSWLTTKGRWVLAALTVLDGVAIDDVFDELFIGFPHDGGPCGEGCWDAPPALSTATTPSNH